MIQRQNGEEYLIFVCHSKWLFCYTRYFIQLSFFVQLHRYWSVFFGSTFHCWPKLWQILSKNRLVIENIRHNYTYSQSWSTAEKIEFSFLFIHNPSLEWRTGCLLNTLWFSITFLNIISSNTLKIRIHKYIPVCLWGHLQLKKRTEWRLRMVSLTRPSSRSLPLCW